ncbi:MAG: acyltransferase [Verrucomicrobia bacterium]|nr:acyltransferase [Verrucomicrobiota bacterium]
MTIKNNLDATLKSHNAGRIPSLDGLRAVAILMVILGHGSYSLPKFLSPALAFAGNGQLGVNVFFALSGYLIFQLSVRERETTGEFDWKQFYVRRVLRIFPCFYFYLAVIGVLISFGALTLTGPMIGSAATFSLNYRCLWDHWVGDSNYSVIGHYWTLALEEQFYLMWPLLMVLSVRRKLVPALVAAILLAPLLRVISYFLAPGLRGQIGMMFHTGFDSIAVGVLLGELLRRTRPKACLERLARNPWIVGTTIVFLVFLSPLLTARFKGMYSLAIGKTLELSCLGILITAAVSQPGTFLFRFLNWRPVAYIGVLSYSLYVWNNLFLNGEGHWMVNTFPLNFVCVAGTAAASHYLIEKPFLKLKSRFHRSSKPGISPVSTRGLPSNAPAIPTLTQAEVGSATGGRR